MQTFRIFLAAMACLLCGSAAALTQETITIGAEDDWYPYSGKIKGKAAGLTADLVRAAFSAVGINVRFESLPYARCLNLTKQGRLLACNEPVKTKANENQLLWPANPTVIAKSMIYARKPSEESGLNALSLTGKHVVVQRAFEYGIDFDSNPNVRREVTLTVTSLFRMLAAGRADYGLAYEKVANYQFLTIPEFKDQFVAVGQTGEFAVYCAFSKAYPHSARYLALYNKGFSSIQNDGTYEQIIRRWP